MGFGFCCCNGSSVCDCNDLIALYRSSDFQFIRQSTYASSASYQNIIWSPGTDLNYQANSAEITPHGVTLEFADYTDPFRGDGTEMRFSHPDNPYYCRAGFCEDAGGPMLGNGTLNVDNPHMTVAEYNPGYFTAYWPQFNTWPASGASIVHATRTGAWPSPCELGGVYCGSQNAIPLIGGPRSTVTLDDLWTADAVFNGNEGYLYFCYPNTAGNFAYAPRFSTNWKPSPNAPFNTAPAPQVIDPMSYLWLYFTRTSSNNLTMRMRMLVLSYPPPFTTGISQDWRVLPEQQHEFDTECLDQPYEWTFTGYYRWHGNGQPWSVSQPYDITVKFEPAA